MIFFGAGGWHIIGACRMRQDLTLIQKGHGYDLRDHKTGSDTRTGGEKSRQAFINIGINQAIDPTLADTCQIGQRNCRVIKRQGEWGTVEVAARENLPSVGKDERVICGGATLYFHYFASLRKRITHGPMHLWHTAQTISILDSGIIFEVRVAYLTVAQQ